MRLYRILELLDQLRMFTHGLHTNSVNPEHPQVAAWFARHRHWQRSGGTVQLGRQDAALLLEWLRAARFAPQACRAEVAQEG